MGSGSTPESGAGPADSSPRAGSEPPTEGGKSLETDATVDFRPDVTGLSSNPSPPAAVPPADYAFLEPPRGGDELGWLAHYRVRKAIGAGGMGLVLLAEDTHLMRPVALKVIRPELASLARGCCPLHTRGPLCRRHQARQRRDDLPGG